MKMKNNFEPNMYGKYLVVTGGTILIGPNLTNTLAKDNDVIHTNLLSVEKNIIGIFSVADDRDISNNEQMESIIQMTNSNGENTEIIYDDSQPGEIRNSFIDITKIMGVSFEPKYTLEQGLKIMRDCFSERMVITH
jgi:nucleoside-diphosphate-sugar epimerase